MFRLSYFLPRLERRPASSWWSNSGCAHSIRNRRQANWQTVDSTFTCGQDQPHECTQIQGLLCRWGGKISVCTAQSPGSNTWLIRSAYKMHVLLSQTSSIDFLAGHDFDFNKLFKQGISYLRASDETRYLLTIALIFFCNPHSHSKPGFCFDELMLIFHGLL